MYVNVRWADIRFADRGGCWYITLVYGDERDGYYKAGWQTAVADYKWTAKLKAKKILRKARRFERKEGKRDSFRVA